MMRDMDRLFELADLGEDFQWPEGRREDLAKSVMVCEWPESSQPAEAAGDNEEDEGDQP